MPVFILRPFIFLNHHRNHCPSVRWSWPRTSSPMARRPFTPKLRSPTRSHAEPLYFWWSIIYSFNESSFYKPAFCSLPLNAHAHTRPASQASCWTMAAPWPRRSRRRCSRTNPPPPPLPPPPRRPRSASAPTSWAPASASWRSRARSTWPRCSARGSREALRCRWRSATRRRSWPTSCRRASRAPLPRRRDAPRLAQSKSRDLHYCRRF